MLGHLNTNDNPNDGEDDKREEEADPAFLAIRNGRQAGLLRMSLAAKKYLAKIYHTAGDCPYALFVSSTTCPVVSSMIIMASSCC